MAAVIKGKKIYEKPFDKRLCVCGHQAGIHSYKGECWSYGLVEPRCRKQCKGFKQDNLKYLEEKYAGRTSKH